MTSTRGWVAPVVLTMAACAVAQGFGRMTFAFVLPDMVPDPVPSFGAAGTLAAVNLAAYLAAVLAMISLSSRVETTRLLTAGLVFSIAGMAAAGLAPGYLVLMLAMVLLGIGSGLAWIACAAIVTAHAPPERRGIAFGIMHSGVGLSFVLIGPIAWASQALVGPGAWRPVWLLEALAGVAVVAVVAWRLAPIDLHDRRGTTQLDKDRRRFPPNLRWLLVSYGLFGVIHALYAGFLIAALQADAGLSVAQSAQVYTLLGLLNMVGGITLGRASDAVGRRVIMVLCLLSMSVCAIVVPVATGAVAMASGATYGLMMSGFSTVVVAYLGDVLSPEEVAAKYSIITAAIGIGQIVAPPVGGIMADATGSFRSTYTLAATVAIIAAACITMLRPGAVTRRAPTL